MQEIKGKLPGVVAFFFFFKVLVQLQSVSHDEVTSSLTKKKKTFISFIPNVLGSDYIKLQGIFRKE